MPDKRIIALFVKLLYYLDGPELAAASTHHPLVTTDSTHTSDDGKQLASASTDNTLVSTQSIEKSDDDSPHDVDFLSTMGK